MNHRAIRDITNFIFMEDAPQVCDVILIPGTSHHEITEKAAELYRNGYAPYVLPSGKFSSSLGRFASERITEPKYYGAYDTDFDYCKHILMMNGVPEKAILCEQESTNTMENAINSAGVLKKAGIEVKRAILCCQAFHARRAFMSYASHFGDAELLVCPTATQGIHRDSWHLSDKSYRKVMSELSKCGVYFGQK